MHYHAPVSHVVEKVASCLWLSGIDILQSTKGKLSHLQNTWVNNSRILRNWSKQIGLLVPIVWMLLFDTTQNVFFWGFGNLGATTWDWPGPPNCAFQQQANKLTLWAEKHLWISIGTNHANYASCIDHDWMFSTWHHLGMAWNRLKVQLVPSLKFGSKTWYLQVWIRDSWHQPVMLTWESELKPLKPQAQKPEAAGPQSSRTFRWRNSVCQNGHICIC